MRRAFVLRRGAPVLALLLAACGGGEGEDPGPAFSARDSAGVRIAESARPAWAQGQGWIVGATPRLEIPTGRPEPALAVRLPDGRIAVAAGWPAVLRVHDPAGARTDTLPLPDGVSWIGPGGADSLLAWDGTYRRLLVFTAAGELARQTRVEGLAYLEPRVLGRLADGTLLVTEGHQEHVDAVSPRRGLVRHLLLAPDGARHSVFAELPDVGRMRGMEVPFSPRTLAAVRGAEVLVGDNRDFEFAVYTPDGTVRSLVRRASTPLPVTPHDVEVWHSRRAPQLADVPAEARKIFEKQHAARRAVVPATVFPAYARLLTDPAGNVWAEEARPMQQYEARWSVFDPAGRWLGTVAMPASFTLLQAGDDWVLGLEPNAAGRTNVRLYPLTKPAGQGGARP